MAEKLQHQFLEHADGARFEDGSDLIKIVDAAIATQMCKIFRADVNPHSSLRDLTEGADLTTECIEPGRYDYIITDDMHRPEAVMRVSVGKTNDRICVDFIPPAGRNRYFDDEVRSLGDVSIRRSRRKKKIARIYHRSDEDTETGPSRIEKSLNISDYHRIGIVVSEVALSLRYRARV